MDKRDDAAPEAVDEDKTVKVQPVPFERWVDVVRGRAHCAICGCFLGDTDALPVAAGAAHFRCVAGAQLARGAQ